MTQHVQSHYCDLVSRAALDGMTAQMGAAGVDLGALEDAPVEEAVAEAKPFIKAYLARVQPALILLTEKEDPKMAITAAMVKELRESTGAGMMDAKKALTETDGDFEAAVDWLRTKGLAKAAKKSGRVAAEGLVAIAVDGGSAVAVEVNSETDFVAKNAEFQQMVGSLRQRHWVLPMLRRLQVHQLMASVSHS